MEKNPPPFITESPAAENRSTLAEKRIAKLRDAFFAARLARAMKVKEEDEPATKKMRTVVDGSKPLGFLPVCICPDEEVCEPTCPMRLV